MSELSHRLQASARYARHTAAQRGAIALSMVIRLVVCTVLSTVTVPQHPILLCASVVMSATYTIAPGEAGMGLGKTWNRAVFFRGRGSGFSPVRFRIGPPPACLLA